MENKKSTGCFTSIVIFIVLMIVIAIIDHVTEQTAKLDWVTRFVIGAIIFGLILAVIHFKNS